MAPRAERERSAGGDGAGWLDADVALVTTRAPLFDRREVGSSSLV